MKLILDTDQPFWSSAMLAASSVMRDAPDQKIGTGNAITVIIRGKEFSVVRNQGSYTVKG